MAQIIMTDGANTKSINPWDVDANPEAWTWLSNAPSSEIDNMFYKVAASFRAVNKRAIAAANVPFSIMQGDKVIDDSGNWQNKLKFMPKPRDLIKRISLSLTFKNAAYLLQGKDVLSQTKNLHFLVPTTITPVVDPTSGQIIYYNRVINGKTERIAADDPKLVKIWILDHTTELLPSTHTAIDAINNSTGAIYFADLFIKNFYERGGVKPTVLALKGAIFNEKKEDIERGWSRFLRNLSRFSSKIFNAETMDVKPIGAGVDDLKNNEVYRQAIENIALGIGMPTSHLLSDWDSYATATVDYMMWQRDDIFPLCDAIADDLNLQIFAPLGYSFKFNTEMSDAETQDEVDRAKAYEVYVGAGIKPSIAAQMVGIELPDGVEYDELDKMAQEKQAQEQAKQQADRQHQLDLQAAKQPAQIVQPEQPVPAKWIPSLDELKELKVWRDVAIRRFKKSEGLDFIYQSHYGGLPESVQTNIIEKLPNATNIEEIKAVFEIEDIAETVTPAPAYDSSAILMLAQSLDGLAAATLKALYTPEVKDAPAPVFNMTMPNITLTTQMPQQGEPSITFAPVIQPSDVAVQVTNEVNPTPVEVKNDITVQPSKTTVVMPAEGKKQVDIKVKRDRDGKITGAEGAIQEK